jgi:hypothetical protein
MALFSFGVSRPISVAYFTPIVVGLFIAYLLLITLVNVVAVGYESITFPSFQYNATHRLWYDAFIPNRAPDYSHRQCQPVPISLNQCSQTDVVTHADSRFRDEQHIRLLALSIVQLHSPKSHRSCKRPDLFELLQ